MHPILLDFPHEFETERLLIRMPLPGDGKAIHSALTHSIEELRPWMSFALNNQTEEETEINTREAYVNFLSRNSLRFLAFLKETGQFVCSSGLHDIDWAIPKFEIGYWIDSRFSGKGYATETAQRLADFAFKELGAKRVEIRCDAKNSRSRAVAERSGFKLEGILEQEELALNKKELRDTCVFAKIARSI